MPTLHLKRMIRLSMTLKYQFQRNTYQCIIGQKLFIQKRSKLPANKLSQMDEKRLKGLFIFTILSGTFFEVENSFTESSA